MNILLACALSAPAPSLEQFPPRTVCEANVAFNRAVEAKLVAALRSSYQFDDPAHYAFLERALRDTRKRWAVWDWAQLAHDQRWHDHQFRPSDVVHNLLQHLSEDDFLAGRLPDPVPLWAFTEKD